jgi:hypothetical protein
MVGDTSGVWQADNINAASNGASLFNFNVRAPPKPRLPGGTFTYCYVP